MDWPNKSQETPLCCAVSKGHVACVSLLLEHGADSTTILPGNVTLLHIAAENGNAEILRILITCSKETARLTELRTFHTRGKDGMTPLHVACWKGHVECVKLLVKAGSSLQAKTTEMPHFGATPLHLAAREGHVNVVSYIVKYDRSTLCLKNKEEWCPLHVAARYAHRDCIRVLLRNGSNLAEEVINNNGYRMTALDIIAFSVADPLTLFEELFDSYIEFDKFALNITKSVIKINYNLFMPVGSKTTQMNVLVALLNCKKQGLDEKLLYHPLVETFLYSKWKKLRVFFIIMTVLYFVFTLSLTIIALFTYVINVENIISHVTVIICRIVNLTSLCMIIIKELFHASCLQRHYLTDMESWVKWSAFFTGAVAVVSTKSNGLWLNSVMSVAVLLAWLSLLFLLSRCPSVIGSYVLIFIAVAKKVFKMMITFTFIILGFTFAFLIHFHQTGKPSSNLWEALGEVIATTTKLVYTSECKDFSDITLTCVLGTSIFITFVILVHIVLMNLLIGFAVSDTNKLKDHGRKQSLARQIVFFDLMEKTLLNRSFFILYMPQKLYSFIEKQQRVPSKIFIDPDEPSVTFPNRLYQSVVSNVFSQRKLKAKSQLSGKIDYVADISEKVPRSWNQDKNASPLFKY